MTINFERKITKEDLAIQVRAVLGVPEEFLTDEVISSPVFIKKASKYIIKTLKSMMMM